MPQSTGPQSVGHNLVTEQNNMYGKMQESRLSEVTPLKSTSAIWELSPLFAF